MAVLTALKKFDYKYASAFDDNTFAVDVTINSEKTSFLINDGWLTMKGSGSSLIWSESNGLKGIATSLTVSEGGIDFYTVSNINFDLVRSDANWSGGYLVDGIRLQRMAADLADQLKYADTINGSNDGDRLAGFAGNDTVYGNAGNDLLEGWSGDDRLFGGLGSDILDGSTGNDFLSGGAGNDSLKGGIGNDVYRLEEYRGGNDVISDIGGSDTLEWQDFNGNNALNLERSGNDLLIKTYALWNEGKWDTWNGSPYQTSTLKGFFTAAGFIETFKSVNPTDPSITLSFVNGNSGTESNNALIGGGASDTINGYGGTDIIFAGLGNDSINGGAGDDRLYGGAGKDTLTGGSGKDTFVFFSGDTGNDSATRDVITDFIHGVDKIELRPIDAKSGNSVNDEFNFVFSVNGSNANGALWFSNGVLYGSVDADTASEFQIQLTGVSTLSSSDFVL